MAPAPGEAGATGDANATGGTNSNGPRIVVIGGGVGGLATAALLARGGAQVTLLERHSQVGGRAGQLVVDGYTFDTGPSWYLMHEAFEHFFALFGRDVEKELDLVDLDPRYRVFFEPEPAGDGAASPTTTAAPTTTTAPATATAPALDVVADAEANYRAFDALSPGDGAAVREYVKDAGDLYRLALDRFLYTTYQRPDKVANAQVLKRLPRLASLLTRPLASRIERTVTDPRLRQILGFHAVFLGSSPRRAPALFSLMSHLDLTEGVRYPRRGMYAVIEALERLAVAEGVDIRTDSRVTGIAVGEDGLTHGVSVARDGQDDVLFRADAVVSAADMHHTETQLLPERFRTHPEKSWAKRSPGVSALLVMVGVKGDLPQLDHHNLFFTKDWDANFESIVGDGTLTPPVPASVYVSMTTQTNPDAAPKGHQNIVLLVPFPSDPDLGATDASRAELTGLAWRYLDQVGEWAGIPDLAERSTVYDVTTPYDFEQKYGAWRGSALGLEHTLRQSAMFRPANVSAKVPNLLYAGSSTAPGIGVPICLISAELAAKRLLGATTVGPLPVPAPQGFLKRSLRKDLLGRIARGESE